MNQGMPGLYQEPEAAFTNYQENYAEEDWEEWDETPCKKCGAALTNGSQFCSMCGTPQEAATSNADICLCGAPFNTPNANFCCMCGRTRQDIAEELARSLSVPARPSPPPENVMPENAVSNNATEQNSTMSVKAR